MKKGINFNIHIKFTNRFIYTFVAFILILIIGIGVFALTPGVAPSPGHLIDEFAPPSNCVTNQVLQWDGTNWVCTDFSAGLWTAIGSNTYYNLGDVGIGTTFPQEKLDVVGNIKASGTICDVNGCIGGGGSGIYTGTLVSGSLDGSDCSDAGGVPTDIGNTNFVCKFFGSSCPSGWVQYQQWSTTNGATCQGLSEQGCPGSICSVTGHPFQNQAPSTCTYKDAQFFDTESGGECGFPYAQSRTCTAPTAEIGCVGP